MNPYLAAKIVISDRADAGLITREEQWREMCAVDRMRPQGVEVTPQAAVGLAMIAWSMWWVGAASLIPLAMPMRVE